MLGGCNTKTSTSLRNRRHTDLEKILLIIEVEKQLRNRKEQRQWEKDVRNVGER
jgi:hypothetical protein